MIHILLADFHTRKPTEGNENPLRLVVIHSNLLL